VAAGRGRIDALDAAIIELIRERTAVSARIQQARIAAGGRRVELARESAVIARYREALGKPGTALALDLLDLCRGTA
jgi:chorismate mutase